MSNQITHTSLCGGIMSIETNSDNHKLNLSDILFINQCSFKNNQIKLQIAQKDSSDVLTYVADRDIAKTVIDSIIASCSMYRIDNLGKTYLSDDNDKEYKFEKGSVFFINKSNVAQDDFSYEGFGMQWDILFDCEAGNSLIINVTDMIKNMTNNICSLPKKIQT